MTDEIDSLLIEVRASTEGFSRDIAQMRSSIDSDLADGFSRAGTILERGLASAIRKGSLGFDDLKRAAFSAFDDIAGQAVQTLVSAIGGGLSGGGGGMLDVSGVLSGLLGLPGRATGGNVSPGRGYMVGERGPELFVPTSAGRIEPNASGANPASREVRVAIAINAPRGASAPQSLQRSSRQVASAVRRAIAFT